MAIVIGGVEVKLGDGLGGFVAAPPEVSPRVDADSIAKGDFNNDGIQDLATATSTTASLSFLRAMRQAIFRKHPASAWARILYR